MKNKIYLLLAVLISLFPLSCIRVFLYQLIFNFEIKKSTVGWLTIINVKSLKMEGASIASCNIFSGPFEIEMQSKSSIGSFNYFRCGRWVTTMPPRERKLILKKEAFIVQQHYFDLFGNITIGERSVIAGVRSQFWTHGSLSSDVDIFIGKECYIGSGVKFAAGTKISDFSLLGLGSVVTKKFTTPNALIAGVPAKLIKSNVNWRENWK
jgi:bifunctional N-acetylglucosamine-1-phosphate-uridyltransferase/glucosamine-1-phosphate-acetyltransferase GlmU-like protein